MSLENQGIFQLLKEVTFLLQASLLGEFLIDNIVTTGHTINAIWL